MVGLVGSLAGAAAIDFILRITIEDFRAEKQLKLLEHQAAITTQAVDKLDAKLSQTGKRGGAWTYFGAAVKAATITLGLFTAAVAALIYKLGPPLTNALLSFTSTMTDVRNRLRAAGQGVDEMRATISLLFKTSRATGVNVGALATSFSRFQVALSQTNATSVEIAASLDALAKSAASFGSNSAETAGALLQLSQGMASGTLRGQELNSVLEGMPKFAMAAAQAAGIPFKKLRKAAEEGKISTDILRKAFREFGGEANEIFSRFETKISLALQGYQQEWLRVFDNVVVALSGGHDQLNKSDRGIVGFINAQTDKVNLVAEDYEKTEAITLRVVESLLRAWEILQLISDTLIALGQTIGTVAHSIWLRFDSLFDEGAVQYFIDRFMLQFRISLENMTVKLAFKITGAVLGAVKLGMLGASVGLPGIIGGGVAGAYLGWKGGEFLGDASESVLFGPTDWIREQHLLFDKWKGVRETWKQAGKGLDDISVFGGIWWEKASKNADEIRKKYDAIRKELLGIKDIYDSGFSVDKLSGEIGLPKISFGPGGPTEKEWKDFRRFLDRFTSKILPDASSQEKIQRQIDVTRPSTSISGPYDNLTPTETAIRELREESQEWVRGILAVTDEEHKARVKESDEIFKGAMLDITEAVKFVYNEITEGAFKFSFELGVALNAIGNVALNFVDFFARAAGAAGIESYDDLSSVIGAGRAGYADATADPKDQGAFGKSIAGIATAAGVGSAAGPIGAAAAAGLEIATQAIGHNVKAFEAHTELIERRNDIEKDLVNTIREHGRNSREAVRVQNRLNETTRELNMIDQDAVETGAEIAAGGEVLSAMLEEMYRLAKPLIKALGFLIAVVLGVINILLVLVNAILWVIDLVTFNLLDLSAFQTGGFTGTGRNSQVAGVVHRNEYVLPASTTSQFMAGRSISLHGGIDETPDTQDGNAPMVNIVNVVDPSLVDEYLQSPSGQKQVINIIRANNPAVRSALA